jgi:hypothetical protein
LNRGGADLPARIADIDNGTADVIAVASMSLANPDLVECIKKNAPLNTPDPSTFFGGGSKGYTDYPTSRSKGKTTIFTRRAKRKYDDQTNKARRHLNTSKHVAELVPDALWMRPPRYSGSLSPPRKRGFHARAALRWNKALLLNHEAARYVSHKRFSYEMSCTGPLVQWGGFSKIEPR